MITKEIVFTREPIVAPPLAFPSREIGACVEFQGIVRETEGAATLAGLHYEAYETMAVRTLDRIFEALHTMHGCARVTFIHRLGWVPVGAASLFIRVLAPHRGPALRFCAEAIDLMKQDVPIWKQIRATEPVEDPG